MPPISIVKLRYRKIAGAEASIEDSPQRVSGVAAELGCRIDACAYSGG
jgi:hypothetical protein